MSGNGTASQAPPATARRRVLSIALWVLQVLLALEFAMAGAGLSHNQIVFNTNLSLGAQLRGTRCQGLPSDMRVRIGSAARSPARPGR